MIRSFLLAGLLASLIAVAAAAQDSALERDRDLALADVIALALVDVIPPADDADWARRWDAVGIRAQRIRWHLAAPDAADSPAEEGVRRTGWIPAKGRSSYVVACGDAEEVAAVALRFGGAEDAGFGLLEQALAAHGALLVTREASASTPGADGDVLGRSLMSVAEPGRAPAVLEAVMQCTPEGSRAAQRCWTSYRLDLVPDAEEGSAAQVIASRCTVPGRG